FPGPVPSGSRPGFLLPPAPGQAPPPRAPARPGLGRPWPRAWGTPGAPPGPASSGAGLEAWDEGGSEAHPSRKNAAGQEGAGNLGRTPPRVISGAGRGPLPKGTFRGGRAPPPTWGGGLQDAGPPPAEAVGALGLHLPPALPRGGRGRAPPPAEGGPANAPPQPGGGGERGGPGRTHPFAFPRERRGQEARAGAAPGAVNTGPGSGARGGRCSCACPGGHPAPRGPDPAAPSPQGSSHLPQQLKFTTSDSCDRIKDEFQLLQAQYHSLKLECDKLASEKSEMQRHYVMYYEMSYGLNIEMHKQAEIVKRLNGICAQVLPYLSQEHQQQVLGAIERAKQVTAPELNSIIRQQLQAHQLSQLQALALPLTPLPVGLQPPSLPAVSAGTGLLSLSALGSQAHLSKEDKNGHDGDTHQEDDGEKSD
uniref:TLE family member 2, transcriptional corepressor n=3 Tax=Boreoeutheria TaxID=1437010 RepID=A0A8C0S2S3_CANLF